MQIIDNCFVLDVSYEMHNPRYNAIDPCFYTKLDDCHRHHVRRVSLDNNSVTNFSM